MNSYEYHYVESNEYKQIRTDVEGILKTVQNHLRPMGMIFKFHLVGSGERRMVTRDYKGNKGPDLDYNIILQKIPDGYDPKKIKDVFRNAINEFKPEGYNDCEDSTSVLTMKMVDSKNSRIIHSVDFAIIRYDGDGNLQIIRRDGNGSYVFSNRGCGFDDREYVRRICDVYNDGWGEIREEYLKLKNNSDRHKKSIHLYVEAVRNVYNRVATIYMSDEDERVVMRILSCHVHEPVDSDGIRHELKLNGINPPMYGWDFTKFCESMGWVEEISYFNGNSSHSKLVVSQMFWYIPLF